MKPRSVVLVAAIAVLVLGLALIVPSAMADQGAGAVVLVNSASGSYADFQHYVSPTSTTSASLTRHSTSLRHLLKPASATMP